MRNNEALNTSLSLAYSRYKLGFIHLEYCESAKGVMGGRIQQFLITSSAP